MIVTFRTKAHADITMFANVAVDLLKLAGMTGNVPTAILGADVPRGNGGGLRVIAGRIRDYAVGHIRQREDQIRGAADLERAARLQILAFEIRPHVRFGIEDCRC